MVSAILHSLNKAALGFWDVFLKDLYSSSFGIFESSHFDMKFYPVVRLMQQDDRRDGYQP